MLNFKEFLIEWEITTQESLRELNSILAKNNFDIKFEVINENPLSRGKQINAEMSGKTKGNTKIELADLVNSTKYELAQKGLYLKIQYSSIDASGEDFKCICAIIQVN